MQQSCPRPLRRALPLSSPMPASSCTTSRSVPADPAPRRPCRAASTSTPWPPPTGRLDRRSTSSTLPGPLHPRGLEPRARAPPAHPRALRRAVGETVTRADPPRAGPAPPRCGAAGRRRHDGFVLEGPRSPRAACDSPTTRWSGPARSSSGEPAERRRAPVGGPGARRPRPRPPRPPATRQRGSPRHEQDQLRVPRRARPDRPRQGHLGGDAARRPGERPGGRLQAAPRRRRGGRGHHRPRLGRDPGLRPGARRGRQRHPRVGRHPRRLRPHRRPDRQAGDPPAHPRGRAGHEVRGVRRAARATSSPASSSRPTTATPCSTWARSRRCCPRPSRSPTSATSTGPG